jgi:tetratricopeptide (TPR) repeat protein
MSERLPETIAVYERGGREAPTDARLQLAWAEALQGLNRLEQARWRLERALALDRAYASAELLLGEVLLSLGLPVEAAKSFKRVITVLEPSSDRAYGGSGHAAAAENDYAEAARMFERAVELSSARPASYGYLLDLGDSLQQCGKVGEALEAYARVLNHDAGFQPGPEAVLRANQGSAVVTLELRSFDEAAAHCERGLEVLTNLQMSTSPVAASFHYLLGFARLNQRRYEEAITRYQRAAEISPQFAVYSATAVAGTYARQGRYEEAWRFVEGIDESFAALEAEMGEALDDEQRISCGSAQLWLGKPQRAEELLREVVDRDPSNLGAWMKLMMVYLERQELSSGTEAGNWRWQAYEAYRRVVPRLERQFEETGYPKLGEALGLLHLMMEDLDRAEPLLRQAADLSPDAAAPHTALGMINLARGAAAEANEEFKLALKRDPHDLSLQCQLANSHLRLGNHDLALDTYKEVLAVACGDVGAHVGVGEVLIEQAEERPDDLLLEEAEGHLSEAISLAETVRPGGTRKGSMSLGLRQWADVYYLRGYVRVKIYENLAGGALGRASKTARDHLVGARGDFKKAQETGIATHRAEHALRIVETRLKPISAGGIGDSYGPLAVAAVTLLLLILIQVAFLASGGFSHGKDRVSYASLTVSLVVLLAAAFYLPQLLKLKFGGLELEKTTGLQYNAEALDIARRHVEGNLYGKLEPDFSGFRDSPPPGRTGSNQGAQQGVHAGSG